MQETEEYVNERLDHLGIVAGVCQEIGLAGWLDAQAPERRQQVSVGTATVAMALNGLGFSHRQLYLVSQFFANKSVEHLLGAGVSAELLNDDCLGRTLDRLYEHDLTKLFAGIASRARQVFGVKAEHIHVDTTSFAVSGEYLSEPEERAEADTPPLGGGQFELLSQSLDSALDSPYPCFSRSFLFSPFQAARFCLVLHVFVVLLVVCLLLCLALLWRLDWFPLRPSSSRGGAKRTTLQRHLQPRTPDDCSACRLGSTPSLGVQPLSAVENSDVSPNRLTAFSTRRILASRGVLLSPHF